VTTCFEILGTHFLESEVGANNTVLLIIKQGEFMNMNRFLFIKDVPERTFHKVKIHCWTELLRDDLRKFSSCILWSWDTLLCHWKCILFLKVPYWSIWPFWKEGWLLMGVLKEKPFRIIPWNLHLMKKSYMIEGFS
jgi:hypothetical protein